MTEPHEKKVEFARRIRDSIKKDLEDITKNEPSLHINAEFRGEAILWDYGGFSGRVNIINSDETKAHVLLELPLDIRYEGNSIYPSTIRTVLKVYDKIEEYLKKNCGEPISEHLGRRCFSMKKIP